MTTKTCKILFFLTICLILAGATGCAPQVQVVPIEGQEREQILATTEPIADHIFTAMSDRDYTTFSQYFDDGMKKAVTEKAFEEMLNIHESKIGKPLSRTVQKVERVNNFVSVTYQTRYEKEEVVSVRLVFTAEEPVKFSGLWLDSPKLRAK